MKVKALLEKVNLTYNFEERINSGNIWRMKEGKTERFFGRTKGQ